MHKERLLKLAELLEADAANPTGLKFDLGLWGSTDLSGACYDERMHLPPVSISCNTAGCAMGLAVLSGAFADAGLINGSISKHQLIPEMRESRESGFYAAVELFGIRFRDAEYLFMDENYQEGERVGAEGELAVAARIREFVADHSPEDITT